ncbi:hypothetical protein EBB07_19605 [Paenibacillaceae bacterium]|nr:hypothetical protein EBB07_19605 [Paenibacillaceae bacterium]
MSFTTLPRYVRHCAAAAVIAIAVTGCQNGSGPLQSAEPQHTAGVADPASEGQQSSPQQTYNNQQRQDEAQNITPPDSTGKTQGSGEKANTEPNVQKEDSTAKKAKTPAWDSALPKLNSLAIGDSKESVVKRFGEPNESYTLADEKESLTVSEYNGFSVGFNDTHRIQFIEIYDANVATGLNGLGIGDAEDAALKALGKPNSHTSYLLGYKAAGALLKLDLDPKSKEIISIKLFVQV